MKKIYLKLSLLVFVFSFSTTNAEESLAFKCWSADDPGDGGYYRCMEAANWCYWVENRDSDGSSDECVQTPI